jgi:cytochrome P450
MQPGDYNPFSPVVQKDPYPYYAALREGAPVFHIEALRGFAVSRYDDVVFVLKNPGLFSSDAMNVPQMISNMGPMPGKVIQAIQSPSLVASDPPRHTRLRSVVNRAFTPRRMADLEPRIRSLTRNLLQGLLSKGEGDFMSELAGPLPLTVIAELLGVESQRQADFKRWSHDIVVGPLMKRSPEEQEQIGRSYCELYDYFEQAIAQRREAPREDLISALVHGSEQEGVLSPEEVMSFCRLLLVAGNETTANLVANTLVSLLCHPEQLVRLRADRSLVANTVEEGLRYNSPALGALRRAREDVELAGVKVTAGSMVLALIASANRDSSRFQEPERFDITRDVQGQIAFGHGIHFCLGAALARLEARVVMEELLDSTRDISFAPGQAESIPWMQSFLLRGPRSLRLRFEWR